MEFLAHITEDGRTQTVREHLCGTAALCAEFASAFGAEDEGRAAGLMHDIGKYSDEFQRRLRGGSVVDHSTAGAFECGKTGHLHAAFCIAGHHGGIPDGGNNTDNVDVSTLCGRMNRAAKGKLPKYDKWRDDDLQFGKEVRIPAFVGKEPFTDSFFTRMLYSCLVDADFLDTERFMSDGAKRRGGYESAEELAARMEEYVRPWRSPQRELDRLRTDILDKCIDAGALPRGLYTLTIPTGGGKTVSSMAFALRHMVSHGMKRVIYVIPYNSIIEQNAAVFRRILGDENVVEHHSGASFNMDENNKDTEDNGTLSLRYRQALAAENWDAPVIVTTAVQFFESLYSNRPSKCRKLHNIANSVIIFDEAQTIPNDQLRPCVAAIAQLVRNYGATAVLCTATQPVLDDLIKEYAPDVDAHEIFPQTHEIYGHFRRVTFRNAGNLSTDELCAGLLSSKQVLCIVNTRRAAQEVYKKLSESEKEGSFHLSTLMYPAHRRKVLDEIRKRLKNGDICRVVSTSLIEAGVDVDFPAVWRELTGLDSVLQAAGRCNREGRRSAEDSVVTVFSGISDAPSLIGPNIAAAKEAWNGDEDPSDPEIIKLYFTRLLSMLDAKHDKNDVTDNLEKGIDGCQMPFRQVAEKFHLIDDSSKTIYIPLDEGEELVRRMLNGEHSRSLYRMAGQYAVGVYDRHFRELLQAGDIRILDEDSAVLTNISLYNQQTAVEYGIGLSMKADAGKGIFT